MKFTYLLINFLTILVPFIFSFHPRIQFNKAWKSFFPATIVVALIFILWDVVFTNMGVWSFNPKYLVDLNFLNLPIEEILFFFCIPYACVFTYFCLVKFYNMGMRPGAEKIFSICIVVLLLSISLIFWNRLYTAVTFLSTAVIILLAVFVIRINWFGKAIQVYLVLLLPFLIVNGLLTGTWLDEPVVNYNDNENMGIRLLTIPIEDVVYGFELFFLNLILFHALGNRNEKIQAKI